MLNANTIVVMVIKWLVNEISKISKVIHYFLATKELSTNISIQKRKNWWEEGETQMQVVDNFCFPKCKISTY